MYNHIFIKAILCLAMLGQGCSAFDTPNTPLMPPLPEQLTAAPQISDLKITATLLELVKDSQAKSLVAEALESNPDLSATALRLESAGLLLSRTASARLPKVDAGYGTNRNNQYPGREVGTRHKVSLSLSWELDVWGKLADRHTAREEDFKAQQQTYYRAMDSLAARVLQTWFRVKANKMRLDIHNKRVAIYHQIEKTIMAKYTAGLGNIQDISGARSKTNLARSNLTRAQDVFQSSVRELELLLGRYPATSIKIKSSLPEVVLSRPEAPAAILANRPDVRAALKTAQSAMSDAKAGHKELLPAITLTGNLFRDNAVLGRLGSSENGWGMAGNLIFPLFNAGRIEDEAGAADARAKAAYKDLGRIVLQAMKEAENAFSKETHLKKQLIFLERAMGDARQSSAYYEARFKEGLASIIELHTARDQELDVLSGILDVKASRIINRVDMALSIGTGVFERNENESI